MLARDESVDSYLERIDKYPRLSREQEQTLAIRAKGGDNDAVEQLILSNLLLVVHFAKRFQWCDIEMADLIEEGNIGLIKAARQYDARGVRFATYAQFWICQSLSKAVTEKSRTVRLPTHTVKLLRKVWAAIEDLHGLLGRDPNEQEIADYTGMDIEDVRLTLPRFSPTKSINKPIFGTGGSDDIALQETIADSGPGSDAEAGKSALCEDIATVLLGLPYQHRRIIEMYFGLGCEPHTLESIRHEMGCHVSRERIRQIKKGVLQKLRRNPVVREYAGGLE